MTLTQRLGIAAKNVDGPKTITLDVQIYHRLTANGDELLDTKRQNSHVWVIDDFSAKLKSFPKELTDEFPQGFSIAPTAEQVPIESLPKELQERIRALQAKTGPGKRFYACFGKEADSQCFGMAKPNANWQLLE